MRHFIGIREKLWSLVTKRIRHKRKVAYSQSDNKCRQIGWKFQYVVFERFHSANLVTFTHPKLDYGRIVCKFCYICKNFPDI